MIKEYTHPECYHECTSNCRRVGCNCKCGEFHGKLTLEEYKEAVSELNAELAEASVSIY